MLYSVIMIVILDPRSSYFYIFVYPILNGVAYMQAANIYLSGRLIDQYYIMLIILYVML